MTALSNRKTKLTFETAAELRNRAIVVEPTPYTCVVRLKGSRTRYEVAWTTVFMKAAEIAADRLRAERKQARKNRKFGK